MSEHVPGQEIRTVADLAADYRHGAFAWPGGYPCYLHLSDGEPLCWSCWRQEYGQVADALRRLDATSSWFPIAMAIEWEGEAYCAQCGARLDVAYPEED